MANIKVQIPTVKREDGWKAVERREEYIRSFLHYRVSLFSYVYVCRVI